MYEMSAFGCCPNASARSFCGSRPLRGHEVRVQRRQPVVWHLERVLAKVLVQVPGEHAPIDLVRDAAAVVGLGDEILQRVPRRVLVRVEVRLQDVVGDGKVRVVEVVRDVDAQRSKLSSLEHDGVEVRQREEELRVLVLRLARVEGLLRDARLTALENREREVRRRVGRQPQPEVLVRLLLVERLDDLLQVREPRQHEVAVREEHPVPFDRRRRDELRRHRGLALTERDAEKLFAEPLGLRELLQVGRRVDAGG
eukprot:31229-Pelagococcus_subviridis.AAC.8